MLGQGPLSPVSRMEAEIKSQIGDFLQSEKILLPLVNHPALTINTPASQLWQAQKSLEAELNSNLAALDQMKQGTWSIAGLVDMGNFAMDLMTHNSRVRKLQGNASQMYEAGGPAIPQASMIDWNTMIQYGIVGLGMIWVAGMFTKRRRQAA